APLPWMDSGAAGDVRVPGGNGRGDGDGAACAAGSPVSRTGGAAGVDAGTTRVSTGATITFAGGTTGAGRRGARASSCTGGAGTNTGGASGAGSGSGAGTAKAFGAGSGAGIARAFGAGSVAAADAGCTCALAAGVRDGVANTVSGICTTGAWPKSG